MNKNTDSKKDEPLPEIDESSLKEFTAEELKAFDGTDESKPIYVGVKGIFFVIEPEEKKASYKVGGSYHIFAGKDASYGLGKSSLKPEDAKSDYSGLNDEEMKVLDDWYKFFRKRYEVVGKLKK